MQSFWYARNSRMALSHLFLSGIILARVWRKNWRGANQLEIVSAIRGKMTVTWTRAVSGRMNERHRITRLLGNAHRSQSSTRHVQEWPWCFGFTCKMEGEDAKLGSGKRPWGIPLEFDEPLSHLCRYQLDGGRRGSGAPRRGQGWQHILVSHWKLSGHWWDHLGEGM